MSENTRDEILDIAEELFFSKGYENTSIEAILKKAKIARGTLYYYFKNKEDLLDKVIDRQGIKVLDKARLIARDKSIAPEKRLIMALVSMTTEGKLKSEDLESVHDAHNALLHQKINNYLVKHATEFLTEIIEDGIETGVFACQYPKQSVEMILIYSNVAFDHMSDLEPSEELTMIQAFIANIHRLFGAKEGTLDFSIIFGGHHEN